MKISEETGSVSGGRPFVTVLKGFLTLCSLSFLINATGQTAIKYVPSDVPFALTMNLQNLDKKVNLAQLQQFDFYNALIKEYSKQGADEAHQAYYKEFMQSPANLGYDIAEPFYFFAKKEGNQTFLTAVLKLASRSKYEDRLKAVKQDNYLEHLQSKDGYMIWQDEKETYAWNDEVVINVWSMDTPDFGATTDVFEYEEPEYTEEEYPYEEEEVYEEEPMHVEPMEEVVEEPEPLMEDSFEITYKDDYVVEEEYPSDWEALEKQATTAAWVEKIMTRNFLKSLSTQEEFRAATAQPSDVHFWMDYGYLMETMYNPAAMGGMGMGGSMQQYMTMMQGFMDIFYADTYMSMGLNFEDGKMALRSEVFFNEEMKKFYKGALDGKFNKKFLKYVKGGNHLFGYMYINYNIKKMIAEGKGLMYSILGSTPGYGELATEAMKILGIFIDEDAIGNLLKGDILIAVSGMQTTPVTTTTYEMDDEFNLVTKDTTMLKTMPIFTTMLSYGSEKDIMKFINLGVHSSVLTKQGNYYKMTVPGMGVDVYLTLNKGVLLLTNDQQLVTSRLESGYDRSQRLSKKHRKLLCENATVMYWDIPNTIRAVGEGEAGSDIAVAGYMEMLGKEFESIEATASNKVDNSVKGQFNFNFVNKKTNSLQQFFRFVNDIYLEYIGGAKI